MTLSDRIADVRRKAVAYRDVNAASSAYTRVWADLYNAMSADFIIQMADRIEELEKERDEVRNKALDEAALLLVVKSFENVITDATMSFSLRLRTADAVAQACASAILALKSKEPTP